MFWISSISAFSVLSFIRLHFFLLIGQGFSVWLLSFHWPQLEKNCIESKQIAFPTWKFLKQKQLLTVVCSSVIQRTEQKEIFLFGVWRNQTSLSRSSLLNYLYEVSIPNALSSRGQEKVMKKRERADLRKELIR